MSTNNHLTQLQQDLQNELMTTNQLLRLIYNELQIIKQFTATGAEFESNILKNVHVIKTLANVLRIDFNNLSPEQPICEDNENMTS